MAFGTLKSSAVHKYNMKTGGLVISVILNCDALFSVLDVALITTH